MHAAVTLHVDRDVYQFPACTRGSRSNGSLPKALLSWSGRRGVRSPMFDSHTHTPPCVSILFLVSTHCLVFPYFCLFPHTALCFHLLMLYRVFVPSPCKSLLICVLKPLKEHAVIQCFRHPSHKYMLLWLHVLFIVSFPNRFPTVSFPPVLFHSMYPHSMFGWSCLIEAHTQVDAGEFTDSEIVVMLGENGTGKTTFIRLLAGLIKPDDESVEVESFNVSYKPQKISPRFDSTVRNLFHKKIRDSYMHPQFVSDVIKPLNIEALMDQEVQNLSGGALRAF